MTPYPCPNCKRTLNKVGEVHNCMRAKRSDSGKPRRPHLRRPLLLPSIANLVAAIREASADDCRDAMKKLQVFADSWLVNDKLLNLEGAGECCLSDCDTTERIKEALEIWIESKE